MEEIAVIIVLYNPDIPSLGKKLKGIKTTVIIVDNSENDSIMDNFGDNIIYIPLHCNTGIANAQNVGISKAVELNKSYLVFFDQDTSVKENIIELLFSSYHELKKRDPKVGALGPVVCDNADGAIYDDRLLTCERFIKIDRVISSGMFIELSLLEKVGRMNQFLFIDNVDSEFCWRIGKHGYNCYIDNSIHMSHKIGSRKFKLFGFKFIISAPKRYYYQYRNFFILCRFGYVPNSWKIKNLIRRSLEMLIIPIYAGQLSVFCNMIYGTLSGIRYLVQGIPSSNSRQSN